MLFKPYFAFLSHPVIFQTFPSLFVILLSLTEMAFSCTLWRKAKRFLKFFQTLWRLFSSSRFIPYFIDPYFSSASHSSIRSAHTFCQPTEAWTVLLPICIFVGRWSSLLKSTVREQVKILLVHFPVFRVFSNCCDSSCDISPLALQNYGITEKLISSLGTCNG